MYKTAVKIRPQFRPVLHFLFGPFLFMRPNNRSVGNLRLKPFKSASSALPAVCVWREGPTGRLVCVNFVYFFATNSLLYLNIYAPPAVAADVLQSTVLLLVLFCKKTKEYIRCPKQKYKKYLGKFRKFTSVKF